MWLRRRTRHILILALIIYALVGMAVFLYVLNSRSEFKKEITLEINGTTSQIIDMEGLNLKPGEVFEYTINIKCELEGHYNIKLSLSELRHGGLEQFVDTQITYESGTANGNLLDLLNKTDEVISYDCTLSLFKPQSIVLRYSLPESVGNDAQGKFADFKVVIDASYNG